MIAALALFLFAHDWLILPGERVGPLTASTSEQELVRAVGEENVRRGPVHVGEGETEPGTFLYPDEPARRLAILWVDEGRSRPRIIDVCADMGRKRENCEWRTAQGITLGTPLKEIEVMNGRPFLILGFAWDYEGTVIDWRGGKLGKPFTSGGRLLLRLAPRREAAEFPDERQVLGDRSFSSGHPAMQRIDPKVYAMIVEFER